MDFVELRAHTAFSFGDGAVTPEALAARAAELDYPALGLTDTADFGGIPRFVLEAQRRGVKPIVGAEIEVDGHPMAFLVETAEGYCNLAALVTRARVGELAGWDREHPRTRRGRASLTSSQVAERRAGLIALTGPPPASWVCTFWPAGGTMLPARWRAGARCSATGSPSRSSFIARARTRRRWWMP